MFSLLAKERELNWKKLKKKKKNRQRIDSEVSFLGHFVPEGVQLN